MLLSKLMKIKKSYYENVFFRDITKSMKYHAGLKTSSILLKIEQKGMTFDHDFGYSLPLLSSLLEKEERRKDNQ